MFFIFFLLEVGFLFFKFEIGNGFDLVVYFLFRDFSLVFDLRDKGFFPPLFPDKTKLYISSPDPAAGGSHQNIAEQLRGAGPRGKLCLFSHSEQTGCYCFL